MKKHRIFIRAFLFFLLTCSVVLRAQTPPYIAPVLPDTIVKGDTLNYSQRFEQFGYVQKLNKVMWFNTPFVELNYYDVDTVAQQISLYTSFPLRNFLVTAMARDFNSDTSLAPVAEPLKTGNKQDAFQFGKMTLKWNSGIKGFLSEGPLPLLAIGNKTINKQVNGYVMLELKRSGNVMSIYLENGKGGWYTFSYSNGVMLVYTPDEKLKSKIAKHHIVRDNSPDPKYKCVLGSPNERNLILKKVKRAEYVPNQFISNEVRHSAADTARIDSMVVEINKRSIPGLYSSSISKTFDCEDSGAEGTVTVLSGENLTKIIFTDCGSDHGGSGFEAVFYYDKLIYFYEEAGSWSFDAEHATDSTSFTVDETIMLSEYIENGLVIKSIRTYSTLSSYTGERKSIDGVTYYFDKSGGNVAEREKRIRQWIDFAHSKKSYADFFQNGGK